VESPVELAVPTAVQAMALRLTRGGEDGCRAGHGGEGGLGAEAAHVTRPAEQLGSEERADTGQSRQRRSTDCDEASELRLEVPDLAVQCAQPGEALPRELWLCRAVADRIVPRALPRGRQRR
jgi:hypothetical protein